MSASNLASLLVDSARERPQRTAIELDDVEVSYEQLDEGSARVAALLKTNGHIPGDRVDIMLPNVPQFALAYYGPCVPEGSLSP
jgi:long-chain acyl-CoA synthetase